MDGQDSQLVLGCGYSKQAQGSLRSSQARGHSSQALPPLTCRGAESGEQDAGVDGQCHAHQRRHQQALRDGKAAGVSGNVAAWQISCVASSCQQACLAVDALYTGTQLCKPKALAEAPCLAAPVAAPG